MDRKENSWKNSKGRKRRFVEGDSHEVAGKLGNFIVDRREAREERDREREKSVQQ